jgi:hypothetical protein
LLWRFIEGELRIPTASNDGPKGTGGRARTTALGGGLRGGGGGGIETVGRIEIRFPALSSILVLGVAVSPCPLVLVVEPLEIAGDAERMDGDAVLETALKELTYGEAETGAGRGVPDRDSTTVDDRETIDARLFTLASACSTRVHAPERRLAGRGVAGAAASRSGLSCEYTDASESRISLLICSRRLGGTDARRLVLGVGGGTDGADPDGAGGMAKVNVRSDGG